MFFEMAKGRLIDLRMQVQTIHGVCVDVRKNETVKKLFREETRRSATNRKVNVFFTYHNFLGEHP